MTENQTRGLEFAFHYQYHKTEQRGFRAAEREKGLIWSYIALHFESERHPNHYSQSLTPIIHGQCRISTVRPYVT